MKTLQRQNFYAAYIPGVVIPYVSTGTDIILAVFTRSKYIKQILNKWLPAAITLNAIDANNIANFGGLILWQRKQYLT